MPVRPDVTDMTEEVTVARPEPCPPPTLRTWGLLTALLVVPFLWMAAPYTLSVVAGLILAAVSYPLYARARRRLAPVPAALAVTGALGAGVLIPVTGIAMAALRQSTQLAKFVNSDALSPEHLAVVARRWPMVGYVFPSNAALREQLRDTLDAGAEAAGDFAMHQLAAVPEVCLQLLIIVMAIFFFLVDGRRLFHWVRARTPLPPSVFDKLSAAFSGAARGSVLASLVASGVHGVAILISFAALGVPGAFLAAGAGFVLSWIPMVGVIPVWAGGTVWLLAEGRVPGAMIVVGMALMVAIVDTFVRPWVLRGHHELHPLLGLVAILGGLATIGILGLLIGPVLASMTVAALDIWPMIAAYCGVTLLAADPVEEEVTGVRKVVS